MNHVKGLAITEAVSHDLLTLYSSHCALVSDSGVYQESLELNYIPAGRWDLECLALMAAHRASENHEILPSVLVLWVRSAGKVGRLFLG